jgi:hypothetical protein
MSAREKYLRILSTVLPAGALGASLLLAAATTAGAKPAASNTPAGIAGDGRIAERLAAIRDAVSEVAGRSPDRGTELAWWGWRNGGGGWRNGGWGWRNGGWGNGGWRNGGWRNFWRNW